MPDSSGLHDAIIAAFRELQNRSGAKGRGGFSTVIVVVLGIDSSRRIVGLHAYSALLEAVENAVPEDEDEYIEWKLSLDLSTAHGAFAVARGILGFANRDHQIAARKFEGCAYLVVGVEPTNRGEVIRIDPSALTAKIDRYVGGVDGPAWDPRFIEYKGKDVLVVAVEPPRVGDPGWPLLRAFENSGAGTLFVRRKGSTDPANPAEIRMLFRRATTDIPTPFELDCSFEPDAPILRLDIAGYIDRVRTRAEGEAAEMRQDAAETLAKQKPASSPRSGIDSLGINPEMFASLVDNMSVFGALGLDRTIPDDRNIDDFDQEVARYITTNIEWARVAWPTAAWSRLDDVCLKVTNPTDTYLTDVRVQLRFDDSRITCLDTKPAAPDKPSKPLKFGEPTVVRGDHSKIHALLGGMSTAFPQVALSQTAFDTWIADDGSIVFTIDKLHPRGAATSCPIRVVVPSDIPGPTIIATGSATALGHHRVIDVQLTAQID